MSKSVEDLIQEQFDETCKKNHWNPTYVEEYTMAAAIKASACFQALGFDYGDRIPSVYKLNDTIKELVASIGQNIDENREIEWYSSGMFRVSKQWDDDAQQWELNISLELVDIYEHRILKDS